MRLLVTRPEPDATRLAERLRAEGHEPLVEPLMVVEGKPATINLKGVQALAFTSANGVRAFAAASPARDVPVFAVGDVTAAAAAQAGFATVHTAGGDVDRLAGLIGTALDPKEGAILHVAGKTVAGDLKGALTALGFRVDRVVLYEARPRTELSKPGREALAAGTLDGVLLFSPRTARIFKDLVEAAHLEAACAHMTAWVLSDNVATALEGLAFKSVEVSPSMGSGLNINRC